MKVVVYAISKNEEKFVNRWYQSMKEADEIYVLDTGSNDNTVKLLEENGVVVKTKIINPWRFDIARNESLKLVPEDTDICVCTDLDEIFIPGWRKEVENAWKKDTNRLRYIFNWSIENNKMSYINEKFCWDSTIDDLLSVSYYNLGIYNLALYHINKAIEYNSDNERILKNKELIIEKITRK